MLELVDNVRPVLAMTDTGVALTFENPYPAIGDLLVVVIAHGTDVVPPAGWIGLVTDTAGTRKFDAYAHTAADDDPDEFVFTSASDELQGALLVTSEANPAHVLEASAVANFAGDTTPPTPAATTIEAVHMLIAVWSTAGARAITAPTGYEMVDTYTDDLIAERTFAIAGRRANVVGAAIAQPDAASDPAGTGSALLLVLRDRFPVTPAELVDLVPGNIGLTGRDTRPPREAGTPEEG